MSTKIQWTDETWNPVVGCTPIASGCKNCYAAKLHGKRHEANWPTKPTQYLRPFSTVQTIPQRLSVPLHWRKPRRVFVNSMSDLFHEDVPQSFVMDVFDIIERCPQHTFQILTKRPGRMVDVIGGTSGAGLTVEPLPNVHLGVSVSTQADANKNISILLQCPAAKRFVSYEPAIEGVDFDSIWPGGMPCPGDGAYARGIDQLIIGGESGPGARPCDVEWIRSAVEQCKAAGVACFVKQLGSSPVDSSDDISGWPHGVTFYMGDGQLDDESPPLVLVKHPKGADPSEWPEDLNVRELIE